MKESLVGVKFRRAEPEDKSELAQVMYLAGKSHMKIAIYDLMFPGSMEEKLEKLEELYTTSVPSWLQYSHYLVIEVNGNIAGALCGYNEVESGGSIIMEAFSEIGVTGSEVLAMYERLESYYRVYHSHPDDAWVIEHVAILPNYRGHGLILPLLKKYWKGEIGRASCRERV